MTIRRKIIHKEPKPLITRRDLLLVLVIVLVINWAWTAITTDPKKIEEKLNSSLSKNKTINALNYSKMQREKEAERLNKEFEPI